MKQLLFAAIIATSLIACQTAPKSTFDLKTAKKIIDWKEANPAPSKIQTIAQLDSYEKAKKAKKQSDDECESSEEEVKKVLKVKKQIK